MKNKPHLMLVDDEKVLLKLTKRGLERLGHQVSTFIDSQDALDTFKASPQSFDLIITDKSMPLLNGLDFIAEIKKVCEQIPLILFTGFIDEEQEQQLKSNVQDITILLKPMRLNQLADHIQSLLTTSRQHLS